MSTIYPQHRVTFTPEQITIAKAKYPTMKGKDLAKELGVGYGKLTQNLKLLKITKNGTNCVKRVEQKQGFFNVELYTRNLVTI